MLILTRHKGQSLVIDGCIQVKIVEIRGDKIRIGVECESGVTVNREEIEDEINPEWRRAVYQTRRERGE